MLVLLDATDALPLTQQSIVGRPGEIINERQDGLKGL
jgi:hypothetical protein